MDIKNHISEDELEEIAGGKISPETKNKLREWIIHRKHNIPDSNPQEMIRFFSIAKGSSPEDHKELEAFILETWEKA